MKVFLSWSGEPSRSVAKALARWLGRVIQSADVWMSDEAIASGSRWNAEVAEALDRTDVGIVCLTRANQHAPWLMFEAGALAKNLKSSRLVPLRIDIAPAEVTGPLDAFQGRSLDHDGVHRLIRDLNAASERPIDARDLDETFELWWPNLAAMLQPVRGEAAAPEGSAADQRKLILLDALQGRYDWRHLDRLSQLVGLPEQETRDLLIEVGARAALPRPGKRESWGLISRVGRS